LTFDNLWRIYLDHDQTRTHRCSLFLGLPVTGGFDRSYRQKAAFGAALLFSAALPEGEQEEEGNADNGSQFHI
jgi:hypothetical protein